jgi:hypothetical protein
MSRTTQLKEMFLLDRMCLHLGVTSLENLKKLDEVQSQAECILVGAFRNGMRNVVNEQRLSLARRPASNGMLNDHYNCS